MKWSSGGGQAGSSGTGGCCRVVKIGAEDNREAYQGGRVKGREEWQSSCHSGELKAGEDIVHKQQENKDCNATSLLVCVHHLYSSQQGSRHSLEEVQHLFKRRRRR
jgi:hypothetical protein